MTEFTDGTAKLKVTKSSVVLPGTVTAFSGTVTDGYPVDKNTGVVNREWHLCDGTNGTPDLRSRFIYGGDGTNNGATGGEVEHTLTKAELASHGHDYKLFTVGGVGTSLNDAKGGKFLAAVQTASQYDAFLCGENKSIEHHLYPAGGNQPHNNMPPYYVLTYIMKL